MIKKILLIIFICAIVFNSKNTFAAIGPSALWNGTKDSGGNIPLDPTRSTFKPILHFTIPPYQDVVENFDVPVMSFAKGGIEKVRFYVEGNTIDVSTPIRYTKHNGRPYEAYVITLDPSLFPKKDGAFRIYAESYPNDKTAQRRVISLDLWFNGGKTLPGSNVEAYIDSRASLSLSNSINVTAGNRIIGGSSNTMAVVVESANNSNSLIVSPISMDGGITQPQFSIGETISEVLPNGTLTGNTGVVASNLSYYGTNGSYPNIGKVNNPFWHLRAASDAITKAGLVSYIRANYYFKDGSYSLTGINGKQNNFQYVNLIAAPGSNPTVDYGITAARMSYINQHIKGFKFRKAHTFTGSTNSSSISSGTEDEKIWLNNVLFEGDAPNAVVVGSPSNGVSNFITDSTVRAAGVGLSGNLVRNSNIYFSTNDSFSHSRAVINSSANEMKQIAPSHTDIYQFETGNNAENILIYGLKVLNIDSINASLFLTGEGGANYGSFRDWAIINYLSEENRDDISNNLNHFLFWNSTQPDTTLTLGLGGTPEAKYSSFQNNWVNNVSFSTTPTTQESIFISGSIIDTNNFSNSKSKKPGTTISSLTNSESFINSSNDEYTPTVSMPKTPRLVLLDVNGNYRAPISTIGAVAHPSEYANGYVPAPPPVIYPESKPIVEETIKPVIVPVVESSKETSSGGKKVVEVAEVVVQVVAHLQYQAQI